MEKFIKEITRKAGRAVLKRFGKVGIKYSKKNVSDVVTEADLASNRMLVEAIRRRYPSHGIISEEEPGYKTNSEYIWLIDPLDGSWNFATRTPLFGIAVGFARKNKMELAAIFDPCQNELFFAKRGKGAYRNNKKIRCSEKREWSHSGGCVSANFTHNISKRVAFLKKLFQVAKKEPFWINSFGSTTINSTYVADGRRDWYYSGGNEVWDYAAASLILSEAGCEVTNIEGKAWKLQDRTMLAANKYLHPKLLKIARSAL